jgi:hypothetical protein
MTSHGRNPPPSFWASGRRRALGTFFSMIGLACVYLGAIAWGYIELLERRAETAEAERDRALSRNVLLKRYGPDFYLFRGFALRDLEQGDRLELEGMRVALAGLREAPEGATARFRIELLERPSDAPGTTRLETRAAPEPASGTVVEVALELKEGRRVVVCFPDRDLVLAVESTDPREWRAGVAIREASLPVARFEGGRYVVGSDCR